MKTVRIVGFVTIVVAGSLLILPSCTWQASLRGTFRDDTGPVKHYWIGWKEGLLTHDEQDKWETAYFTENGIKLFNGPPDALVVDHEKGRFKLPGIPAGDVTLFFSSNNKNWGAYEISKTHRSFVRGLDIRMADLIDIDAPLSELVLQCTKDGKKLNCILLGLYDNETAEIVVLRGRKPDYRGQPVMRVAAQSDGKATVDLNELGPGEYTVVGWARPKEVSVRRARSTTPQVYGVQ